MTTQTTHRRALLGAASLAIAATPAAAQAPQPGAATAPAATAAQGYDERFRQRAAGLRQSLAREVAAAPVQPHPNNGDQARYANAIGSDTRGLPHDARGEVDPVAWQLANAAYTSRDPADFEKIPLGGTRKLVNPVGTLAVSLEGLNASHFGLPVAPALASAARAAEAVEIYWQSLLRDVPFAEYRDETSNADLRAAVDELNQLPEFHGPKINNRVTPQTLFRGSVAYADPTDPTGARPRWVTPPGVLDGPLISQFLYRDVPLGNQSLSARIRSYAPANEFLTKLEEWLHVQNGNAPRERIAYDETRRFIHNGRDLGAYAHTAAAFTFIANQLLGTPAFAAEVGFGGLYPVAQPPFAPSNPYLRSRTQSPAGGTFAPPYYQGLINLAASNAIRINYYQKWYE